ncbi:hypothetical protein [Sodalis praecaptivus]|uniref:hypothetical protein n=1 Tax=Sodalis praecaptivus TaxID=1239307 RepID=UPI0031F9E53F
MSSIVMKGAPAQHSSIANLRPDSQRDDSERAPDRALSVWDMIHSPLILDNGVTLSRNMTDIVQNRRLYMYDPLYFSLGRRKKSLVE